MINILFGNDRGETWKTKLFTIFECREIFTFYYLQRHTLYETKVTN